MDELPFEVVYGAWIWRAALLLLVGGALALVWARPRRAARAGWRAARDEAGRPASPIDASDGDTITIAGRLEAEGAAARFEDGAEAAVASAGPADRALESARAERLALVTDGGPVELEGGVELLAGSEEAWPLKPCRKLTRAERERLGAAFVRDSAVICRSLREGDRALASGVLRLAAATEGTDYREPGRRFVLEEVSLVAESPPRVRGPARSRLLRAALAAGALFLIVFGLGPGFLKAFAEEEYPSGPEPVPELKPLAALLEGAPVTRFLAVTPFHRDGALAGLERALSFRGLPGRPVREALVALSDLRGDCAGAMAVMLQHRQFRRVLERAESCGGPKARRIAATAALALGDIEAASRLLRGPMGEASSPAQHSRSVAVHLLAGDLTEAAAAADRAAAWVRGAEGWLKGDKEWAEAYRERIALRFECVGLAARARGGDREARGELERLYVEAGAQECRLLLADLVTGSAREELLGGAGELSWDLERWRRLLSAENALPESDLAGKEVPPVEVGPLLHAFAQPHRVFGFGLERALLDAVVGQIDLSPAAAALRRRLVKRAAIVETLLGRHSAARELVTLLGEDEEAVEEKGPGRAALRAFIELRAGDLDAARAALPSSADGSDNAARAAGALVEALERREIRPRFAGLATAEAVSEALRGDSRRLAEEIRVNHQQWQFLRQLIPIAPWLPDEALAECLRFCRPLSFQKYGTWDAVGYFADLAYLAEVSGEAEMARELAAGAQRLLEAAQRREIAVPLAVLEAP